MDGEAAMIIHFDERELVAKLNELPDELRAAFAASCAERLLPAYAKFAARTGRGEAAALTAILTRLWHDLGGNPMTDSERQAQIDACMKLIPREDDGEWVPEQAAAEDAGAAVAYALRCRLTGQAQEATWAARRAYEALDHYVINRANIDTNEPGAEHQVRSDPLVQAELQRQQRDLSELHASRDAGGTEAMMRLRDRAKQEGAHFFGTP
jgi:uncharacterized protein YjaG (DUF416 family)